MPLCFPYEIWCDLKRITHTTVKMVKQNWDKEVRPGEKEHELAGNKSLLNAMQFHQIFGG